MQGSKTPWSTPAQRTLEKYSRTTGNALRQGVQHLNFAGALLTPWVLHQQPHDSYTILYLAGEWDAEGRHMAKCEAMHCREKMSLSSPCSALGKRNIAWKSTANLSLCTDLTMRWKLQEEKKSGRNDFYCNMKGTGPCQLTWQQLP